MTGKIKTIVIYKGQEDYEKKDKTVVKLHKFLDHEGKEWKVVLPHDFEAPEDTKCIWDVELVQGRNRATGQFYTSWKIISAQVK